MAYAFRDDRSKVEVSPKTETDAAVAALDTRIDNIVSNPITSEEAAQEVQDAKQQSQASGGQTFPSLRDHINSIEDEVVDIRLSANLHESYNSAGEAVRNQVDLLKQYIDGNVDLRTFNIFKLANYDDEHFFDPRQGGDISGYHTSTDYTIFNHIPVKAGDIVNFYPQARFVVEMDVGKSLRDLNDNYIVADDVYSYTVQNDCELCVTMGHYSYEYSFAYMWKSPGIFENIEPLFEENKYFTELTSLSLEPVNNICFIDLENKNLIKNGWILENGFYNQQGQASSANGYCSVVIRVSKNKTYKIKNAYQRFFVFAENSQRSTSLHVIESFDDTAKNTYTPSQDGYLIISTYGDSSAVCNWRNLIICEDDDNVESLATSINNGYEPKASKIESKFDSFLVNDNLLSNFDCAKGKIPTSNMANSFINYAGYNSYYKLLEAGNYECDGEYRFLVIYGQGDNDHSFHDEDGLTSFTIANDCIVVYCVQTAKENSSFIIPSGVSGLTVIDPRLRVLSNIDNVASNSGNILYGKKWVACGDSFTQGSNATGNFDSGPYAGEHKVYPFWIGRRNLMTIVNEAISGSQMCYIPSQHDNWRAGCFSLDRYKNIPNDADYITLYFGINDDNSQSPIGTIDDSVNTTFYGAWNIVMEYLITNHPFAKIGIIITNGSSPQYTTAERAIAEKWGIPYLDMEADTQHIPLMQRVTERSNVCQTALNVREANFSVNPPSDTHPNGAAHEYESTFIEHWLRSL